MNPEIHIEPQFIDPKYENAAKKEQLHLDEVQLGDLAYQLNLKNMALDDLSGLPEDYRNEFLAEWKNSTTIESKRKLVKKLYEFIDN